MRIRRWFLLLFILLIASTWLGSLIQSDAGYVLLSWGNTSIEMNLWLALAMILAVYIIVYLLLKVTFAIKAPWHWMLKWSEDSQLKLKQKRVDVGLLALANGYYEKAHQQLVKLADGKTQPLVVIPALIQTEIQLGWYAKALSRLRKLPKSADNLVHINAALIYMAQQEYQQALDVLQKVIAVNKNHSKANELRLSVLQKLQRWPEVISVLKDIGAAKQMSPDVLYQQQCKAFCRALPQAAQQEDALNKVQNLWKQAPKKVKDTLECALAMAKALRVSEERPHSMTADFIEQYVQKQGGEVLMMEYGYLELADMNKALNTAEAWQKKAPNSAVLQLTLGRMCRQMKLWGKANDYLQASLAIQPSKEAHGELARLEHHLGHIDKSLNHYLAASVF